MPNTTTIFITNNVIRTKLDDTTWALRDELIVTWLSDRANGEMLFTIRPQDMWLANDYLDDGSIKVFTRIQGAEYCPEENVWMPADNDFEEHLIEDAWMHQVPTMENTVTIDKFRDGDRDLELTLESLRARPEESFKGKKKAPTIEGEIIYSVFANTLVDAFDEKEITEEKALDALETMAHILNDASDIISCIEHIFPEIEQQSLIGQRFMHYIDGYCETHNIEMNIHFENPKEKTMTTTEYATSLWGKTITEELDKRWNTSAMLEMLYNLYDQPEWRQYTPTEEEIMDAQNVLIQDLDAGKIEHTPEIQAEFDRLENLLNNL